MPLEITNNNRPAEALQHAFGPALPALTDEQCAVFAELVEKHGGQPWGWPHAQEEFRRRYEPDVAKGRWVIVNPV